MPSTSIVLRYQIRAEISANGVITTYGGRVRCWQNWVPDDDSWLTVVVSHLLPEGGQTEWRTDVTQHHQVAAMSTDQGDEQRLSAAPDP